MKKIFLILSTIILITVMSLLIFNNQEKVKYVEYNGYKLALSVDGENVDTLPSGKFFLVNYECNNGAILTWDYETSTLTFDNYEVNDACSLEFESSPTIYDLVEIGDYISYTGNNGCSGDQCSGWNAKQTATDIYENYGYCYSSSNKFYVYGWRVLYKDDNSVYIVSAGSPECVAGTSSDSTSTISSLNTAALNYCNSSYLSGGTCDSTTAHAFNGDDFYKFTSQYYGSAKARYLYSYNDGGTYGSPYCHNKYSTTYCGYNNDLIDNGGYYWFGSAYSSASTLYWYPDNRYVYGSTSADSSGIRPVLKLDSSIKATGGVGSITNPYTISERSS